MGVPEITPVVGLRANPVGNTPFVTLRVEYWSTMDEGEVVNTSFLAMVKAD